MLSYHPALDVYHSAFRAMRLLVARSPKPLTVPQLRILDFYLLFPALIPSIRLPKEAIPFRKLFANRANRYWFTGEPIQVFQRLEPVQSQALHLLYSKGVVDTPNVDSGNLLLTPEGRGSPLAERAVAANAADETTTHFLGSILAELPVTGQNGLKARTALLDSRYDAA